MPEYPHMSERINIAHEEEFFEEESVRDIKLDFMARLMTIVIAALGLITALAWDRTLEDIFTAYFGPLNNLSQKILYASIITLVAVLVTLFLRRTFIRKEVGHRIRRRRPHHR
jgi:H+/gluconate symporter-like permease